MSSVIKVENLSKQYRLGKIGTGSLSHDLNRWWHSVRGKEDPYLKIGETNDRSKKGNSDYVWSLRDLNFDIKQGDAVGIIGRNGAGKSTLLKILSRVTGPTTGSVKVKGRIASLLEVGTGFHPELSGRENIFLNGAILGMRKHEILRKFDEIVNFSGVERYIDTPVKRYSSGMYVRLAFAVAAHLESEILIVDEVLAVGDAEFQKKCLGKMNQVSKGEGRTVLFVSHNLGAVNNLCNRGIVLKNGNLLFDGETSDAVNKYYHDNGVEQSKFLTFELLGKAIDFISLEVSSDGIDQSNRIDISDEVTLTLKYKVNEDMRGANVSLTCLKEGTVIFRSWDTDAVENIELLTFRKKGEYETKIIIPSNILNPGIYSINIAAGKPGVGSILFYENCLTLEYENYKSDLTHSSASRGGLISLPIKWDLKQLL